MATKQKILLRFQQNYDSFLHILHDRKQILYCHAYKNYEKFQWNMTTILSGLYTTN